MEVSTTCIIATIIVYLLTVVVIGVVFSKKNKEVSDFYLGGRRLGPLVTAMSAEASDMSSWLLMGLPGVAYLTGVADAFWTAAGLAIGTYVNWLVIARRIRNYSQECKAITIPDFFANRYRDKSGLLVGISAIIIVVFFVPYTASGFAACGKLFASLFGVDYHIAMILSAVVIVLYTSVGGFLAASTTDLIQSIVMTIALVIILFFGVSVAGGIDAVAENANNLAGYISLTATHNVTTGGDSPYGIITIISTLAWGLGYFGMPHILLRFMAIKDAHKLRISRRVATIWVVISMGVAIFIGIIGLAMSNNGAIPILEGSASETVIIETANLLSKYGALAAIAAGLTLAGILACTMSTADSQLLAASSSVSQNIIGGLFHIKAKEKTKFLIARLSLILISIVAIVIAWNKDSSVFSIVSFAWAGFGAAFGPLVLFSLFWKRTTKWGGLWGMIAGGIMIFIWKYLIRPLGGAFDIYELLPAFIIGSIVLVIVSLCTKAPEQEIINEFEKVKNM